MFCTLSASYYPQILYYHVFVYSLSAVQVVGLEMTHFKKSLIQKLKYKNIISGWIRNIIKTPSYFLSHSLNVQQCMLLGEFTLCTGSLLHTEPQAEKKLRR